MTWLIVGAAAAADLTTAPESVLTDAKQRSRVACARITDGCSFVVHATPSHWSVRVEPRYRTEDGEELYVPGGNFVYIYDLDGKFVREMPDL